MEAPTSTNRVDAVLDLTLARAFLDGLGAQDVSIVRGALAPQVQLRALLPGGLHEWTGAEVVSRRFERWFGAAELEALEARVVEVVDRAHLTWRFRIRARRLGEGTFVVGQSAYADLDARGAIARLDLVCTGFMPEASDG